MEREREREREREMAIKMSFLFFSSLFLSAALPSFVRRGGNFVVMSPDSQLRKKKEKKNYEAINEKR